MDAARSARRQEMLRLACGDMLGLISVDQHRPGPDQHRRDVASTAAYDAAVKQVTAERGGFRARFAVIGMGRLGGAELGYSSDADVMFVMEPLPGRGRDRRPGPTRPPSPT